MRHGKTRVHRNTSEVYSNVNVVQNSYLQIGLWLLSGAVTRQTVQVFQPKVSTLKSWSFPQFVQYWLNPLGCRGSDRVSVDVAARVFGSFLGIGFVKRWR